MRIGRLLAALAAAACAAACSLSRPMPQATLYAVEPTLAATSTQRAAQTLRIGSVRVVATFAGSELVYRTDDVVYAQDFYHRLIAPPAPMLAARMGEWLSRSGPFAIVSQPGTGAPAPYVLEAVFTQLYGDFRPGVTPTAVVAAQFSLLDVSGGNNAIVMERTIERRVALQDASPAGLVRGYNAAVGEMLAELSAAMAASVKR